LWSSFNRSVNGNFAALENSHPELSQCRLMNWTSSNLTVRVGCRIAYETSVTTPVLFVLRPRLDGQQLVRAETFSFGAGLPSYEFTDVHGNITSRVMLMPGRNEILHDALV